MHNTHFCWAKTDPEQTFVEQFAEQIWFLLTNDFGDRFGQQKFVWGEGGGAWIQSELGPIPDSRLPPGP